MRLSRQAIGIRQSRPCRPSPPSWRGYRQAHRARGRRSRSSSSTKALPLPLGSAPVRANRSGIARSTTRSCLEQHWRARRHIAVAASPTRQVDILCSRNQCALLSGFERTLSVFHDQKAGLFVRGSESPPERHRLAQHRHFGSARRLKNKQHPSSGSEIPHVVLAFLLTDKCRPRIIAAIYPLDPSANLNQRKRIPMRNQKP